MVHGLREFIAIAQETVVIGIHPFREGNTRTIMTFATQFAEKHGFRMNKVLLRENADYVRDALVKASDGVYSEYEYLIRIIEDAIKNG